MAGSAKELSQKAAAAASFPGGGLYTDAPAGPPTLFPRVKAHLYFGHGIEDRPMPQEAIAKLDRALAVWGGNYESEIYQAPRLDRSRQSRIRRTPSRAVPTKS